MQELNESIRNIPIPHRMRRLPISERGFPTPWFVWINPETKLADFRVIGPDKIVNAVQKRLCWLCGQPLGTWFAFTAGPMCIINRVSAEPPEHVDCAEYAAKACPFLSKPNMRRNEKDLPECSQNAPGVMIKRNPGAIAVYVTRSYSMFRVDNGAGALFKMGEPERVHWYAEGRQATRAEVDESIRTGYPLLEAEAMKDGLESLNALAACMRKAQPLLPVA
jgi:hypothetical protein